MSSPELSLDMTLDDSPPPADVASDGSERNSGGSVSMSMFNIIRQSNNQRNSYYGRFDAANRGNDHCCYNAMDTKFDINASGKAMKIYCDKMTQEVEKWKDELSMMRVKNAIFLDDLVKVGADVEW